jgi:hypothetical protein
VAGLLGKPDIGMEAFLRELWMMRNFLEPGAVFPVPGDPSLMADTSPPLHSLALLDDTLEQIYAGHSRRIAAAAPRAPG